MSQLKKEKPLEKKLLKRTAISGHVNRLSVIATIVIVIIRNVEAVALHIASTGGGGDPRRGKNPLISAAFLIQLKRMRRMFLMN